MATTSLEQDLRPALDAYAAELDKHQHNSSLDRPGCTCGYRGSRRSTGMHIAAAAKRAEKAYEAAADAIIESRVAR